MHDTHFLERLERTTGAQTDLALSLYRDAELVRFILKAHAGPEVDRIAIALDASNAPAHVVVARDGAFVTCLGAGMAHKLPVLPKARLDYLADKHVEIRTRISYLSSLEGDVTRKLWRTLAYAGHRVTREAFVALIPIVPLVAHEIVQVMSACAEIAHDLLNTRGGRLRARVGRWSSLEEDMLHAIWRHHWAVGHFTALIGCDDEESRRAFVAPLRHKPFIFGVDGLVHSFFPVALRSAWTSARLGPDAVSAAKPFLAEGRDVYEMLSASVVLTMLGAMYPKMRAECRKAVAIAPAEEPPRRYINAYRNVCATVLGTPVTDRAAALGPLVSHFAQTETLIAERFRQIEAKGGPDDTDIGFTLAHLVHAGAKRPLFDLQGLQLFSNIANIVALSPIEDLYFTEAHALGGGLPLYSHDLALQIIEASQACDHLVEIEDAPSPAPRQARNEACACGSGKKYKRCCGA